MNLPSSLLKKLFFFAYYIEIFTMEKRILGLDPGIAIIGFGLISVNTDQPTSLKQQSFQPRQLELVDFGTIETSAATSIGQRLCTIYEDLHTLLQEFQPDLISVEKLFFYRMANTITVAQARGVILLVISQLNIPYVEFTPPEIKNAIAGYGRADKIEVQEAVAHELGLDAIPRPDDAADALAVALTAWYSL